METKKSGYKIKYSDLFWLFIAGSLLGVLIEGVFCVFRYGHWETHTVAVWGPFGIIYGIGAIVLYLVAVLMKDKRTFLKFIAFASIATIIEYLCGALLKYGLHMKAWDYSKEFLNIDGIICPTFTVGWGLAGLAFSKWCVRPIQKVFDRMRRVEWKVICIGLSIFMGINLLFTACCILRWSQRHRGIAPRSAGDVYIDEVWDDNKMQQRFCEWRFID